MNRRGLGQHAVEVEQQRGDAIREAEHAVHIYPVAGATTTGRRSGQVVCTSAEASSGVCTAVSGAATSWPPGQSSQRTVAARVDDADEAEEAAERHERGGQAHAEVEGVDGGVA